MSSCIYHFPSYSFCDIHFHISTVVLKTKSKIVDVYLKVVLQHKEKKRNLSLHLNHYIELNTQVTCKKGRANEHDFGLCLSCHLEDPCLQIEDSS